MLFLKLNLDLKFILLPLELLERLINIHNIFLVILNQIRLLINCLFTEMVIIDQLLLFVKLDLQVSQSIQIYLDLIFPLVWFEILLLMEIGWWKLIRLLLAKSVSNLYYFIVDIRSCIQSIGIRSCFLIRIIQFLIMNGLPIEQQRISSYDFLLAFGQILMVKAELFVHLKHLLCYLM